MRLPYFPLHAVLFPHLPLPLHCFEERYRAMAADLVADGSPYGGRFVTSMITDGSEVESGSGGVPTRASAIGTVAEIRSAERLADGDWVLLVVGISRARIGTVSRAGAYPLVEVAPLPEAAGAGADRLVPVVQGALDRYLSTVKRYVVTAASNGQAETRTTDVAASLDAVLKPIRLPADPLAASYAVGGVLQIELSRKQQLLELPDAAERLHAELEILQRESSLLAEEAMPPVAPAELRYHPN